MQGVDASYGGQRAVIIKAAADGTVNYTVLDVNEANREARGRRLHRGLRQGRREARRFPSQTKALDKAFELCPEG